MACRARFRRRSRLASAELPECLSRVATRIPQDKLAGAPPTPALITNDIRVRSSLPASSVPLRFLLLTEEANQEDK